LVYNNDMSMKEVPQQFVNSILEGVGIGFDCSENDKQAAELRSATLGKFTEAPGAGNPNGETGKLPTEQDNSKSAQSATGEGSGQDQSEEMPAGEEMNDGDVTAQGKGSPELPDVTVDYKEGEKMGHAVADSVKNINSRLKVIEEALQVLLAEKKDNIVENTTKEEMTTSNVLLYNETTGEKIFLDEEYQPEMEYFDNYDNALIAYSYEKNNDGSIQIIGEAMKRTVVTKDRGGSPATPGTHKDAKAPGDFENLDYEGKIKEPGHSEGASADLSKELKKLGPKGGSANLNHA